MLDADQSAIVLAKKLNKREPFFFIKFGDGMLECINGIGSQTCDGELYLRDLGTALLEAWNTLLGSKSCVYVGDWMSASFTNETKPTRYVREYQRLVNGFAPYWLHYETLLLMRQSKSLVDFYRAVREDTRLKLLIGPSYMRPAAEILKCDFFEIPFSSTLFYLRHWMLMELLSRPFEVVLYGAGMAGHIPVVKCWERYPDRTYINLGSALDPLCGMKTRIQQLFPSQAQALFAHVQR